MTTQSRQLVEIPLSKKKLTLMAIGSLIFVVLGILFVTNPGKYTSTIIGSPTIIFIAGIICILFFGLCFFFIVKKLADSSPGLVISDEGILDNSSGISAGAIKWTEIKNISAIKIYRQRLIMLHLKDPQHYLEKQKSSMKRKLMANNYKRYGTPVSISSNGLKISFNELLATLTEKLKAART